MKHLDALRKIDKNIRGAIAVAELVIPKMSTRQKIAWDKQVGNHLKTALDNIAAIEKIAIAKGGAPL